MKPTLDAATYERERAICDRAAAYRQRITKGERNYLTAEEVKAPEYVACDNAMRGRVEQYELLTDTPADFFAYLGKPEAGVYPVTVWTGDKLGNARKGSSWRVPGSYAGTHMSQFYATINGREFTGRGFGEGMVIRLRETAASKRERAA